MDPSPVRVHVDFDPRISFALQQNDVPVVKEVRLDHAGSEDLCDLVLRLRLGDGFAAPVERVIDRLAAGGALRLDDVRLALDPERLRAQTERERVQLYVELDAAGPEPEPLVRAVLDAEILAFREWPGLGSVPELLAAFVLPNHPAVTELVAAVASRLATATGFGALSGYQSRDRQRARRVVEAVHAELAARGIRYANPPASFEDDGQKVRLPGDVLGQRLGTCLDLALLFAAVVEACGLAPLVVLIDGHAFVGAWLVDDGFPECVVTDAPRLRKRIDLAEPDLIVVEATSVTGEPPTAFARAVADARRHLDDDERFRVAIDVGRARRLKVRPLPMRTPDAPSVIADAAAEVVHRASPDAAVAASDVEPPDWIEPGAEAEAVEAAPDDPRMARIDAWKRRLLDLTLRNRLLNFKDGKRTIPLAIADLESLEDALAANRRFALVPAPEIDASGRRDPEALRDPETGEPVEQQLAREGLERRRLVTRIGAGELDKRSLEVWRRHREGLEEGGANTLFLTLGMLRWFESASSAEPRSAPILLLPLTIERPSARDAFRVQLADDDPAVNVTLIEKLRVEFGLDPTGLDELLDDEGGAGIGVAATLDRWRRAVAGLDRFEVVDEAWIAIQSFQKFLLWRDLEARRDTLLANPVLRHLVERPGAGFEPEADYPTPEGLDERATPAATFCPLDADSSQLAAVFAAAGGRSFVLEGPPGTGKSQTITNLIAQSLATGRRVLFVAEKLAALQVVRARLERIGLGPFCLELHSNKASKREVLAQLGAALDVARSRQPADWDREAERLAALRTELNAYVAAIHERRPVGMSVFRITADLVALRDAPQVGCGAAFPNGDPTAADVDWLEGRRDAVGAAREAAEHVIGFRDHPIAAVRRAEWETRLPDAVDAALGGLATATTRFAAAVAGCLGEFDAPAAIVDRQRLARLEELAALLPDAPGVAAELLIRPGWPALRERLGDAVEAARQAGAIRDRAAGRFRPTLAGVDVAALRVDVQAAADSFWPLSWWRARRPRRALAAHVVDRAELGDLTLLAEHLDEVLDWRRRKAELAAHEAGALFGAALWRCGDVDSEGVARLTDAIDHAGRLRAALLRLGDGLSDADGVEVGPRLAARVVELATTGLDRLAPDLPPGRACRELTAAAAAFRDARTDFERLLDLDADRAFPDGPGAAGWLGTVSAAVEALRAAQRSRLQDQILWRRARARLVDYGLAPLVESLEAGAVSLEDFGPAFERGWREVWWHAAHAADPRLAGFDSTEHDRRIAQFRTLDREHLDRARRMVRAKLAGMVPRGDGPAIEGSELGTLQREIKKKTRHLPVRRLFERIPHLLPRLKPCFLMSPLSVAQYLDPEADGFDVVVFDEASQVTVQDAVGAIARGRAAVVVGDSRQLPPTSFFQNVDDDEPADERDVVELESILDECHAAGLRPLRLNWHYRSRHESLIAFSNHHYYDNRLHTFPSPIEDPQRLGVSLVPVRDGVYDRARSRTNRREAESLVADLLARMRAVDDVERGPSFGVVTFSKAQQELIEELLDAERRADPSLEAWFTRSVEPVFVKNLENVQGDERDTILFSICYGPDAAGRVAMAFGPLNLAGGERRLNVAITRARRQVVVHATLRADQIDLARTNAIGVRHLKSFLDYATRGAQVLAEEVALRPEATFDSPFERDVCEALRRRGHDVDLQVGCSGYRIDLAVKDPEAMGRYLLGIECDGATYHSARTARDRDRTRQAVLEGLGWRLFRIWSTDWWTRPERVLEQLDAAIDTARRAAAAAREREAMAAIAAPPRPGGDIAPDGSSRVGEAVDQDETDPNEPADPAPARFASAPEAVVDAEPIVVDGEVSGGGPGCGGREDRGGDAAVGDGADDRGGDAGDARGVGAVGDGPDVRGDRAVGERGGDAEEGPRGEDGARRPFVAASPDRVFGDGELLMDPRSNPMLLDAARSVLAAEAPIQVERFRSRVALWFDGVSLHRRVRDRIDEALVLLPRDERPVEIGGFLWAPRTSPDTFAIYRETDPDDQHRRGPEELPPVEIANAVADLVGHCISLSRPQLVPAVAQRFGFQRTGSKVAAAIERGIDLALATGRVTADDDRIIAPT